MKEMPVKVRVVPAQFDMKGKFCIVVVVEGFETKEEAEEHKTFLGSVISEAGNFKHQLDAEVQKEAEKKTRHIKLLTDE